MQAFLNSLEPFMYGFVAGWLVYPTWQICKKIYSEAKKASSEWKQPNGKSD